MSDEDKALDNEMLMWKINNQRKTNGGKYEPTDPRYGPKECDECGNPMPAVRRSYGFKNCVGCQSLIEIKGRQFAH